MAGVPHIFAMIAPCLENSPQPSNINRIIVAGDHCSNTLLKQIHHYLPKAEIHLMYGCTEVLRSCHHQWTPHSKDRVIGTAVPDATIRLLENEGSLNTKQGELLHQGPTVARGYWNREAKHFPLSNYGYNSGDIILRGDDDLFYFIERSSDILKIQFVVNSEVLRIHFMVDIHAHQG